MPDAACDWIAVASAEHVRRGVAEGFMQVGHGKEAPLRRIRPGDRVAYYSPTERLGVGPPLQHFTAIAMVLPGEIVRADMGGLFRPFRRAVRWLPARPAPIRPLLGQPGFALSGPHWGAALRFGLRRIDGASMDAIADAMAASVGDDPRAPLMSHHMHGLESP